MRRNVRGTSALRHFLFSCFLRFDFFKIIRAISPTGLLSLQCVVPLSSAQSTAHANPPPHQCIVTSNEPGHGRGSAVRGKMRRNNSGKRCVRDTCSHHRKLEADQATMGDFSEEKAKVAVISPDIPGKSDYSTAWCSTTSNNLPDSNNRAILVRFGEMYTGLCGGETYTRMAKGTVGDVVWPHNL